MTGPQQQTALVDVHVHTMASHDGHATPEALLRRAEGVGLDGVVVTDHDTVEGAQIVRDLAEEYDVVALPGCEVSTADGHLLAIGVEEAPEPGRPLPETARSIRAEDGLAVVPHPFQRSRHGASEPAIVGVDGVEVYNALTLTGIRNGQARRFARRRDIPAFGGSDAHRASGVGRAATAVSLPPSSPVTPTTLVSSMADGRTATVGGRASTRQCLTKLVDAARVNAPLPF